MTSYTRQQQAQPVAANIRNYLRNAQLPVLTFAPGVPDLPEPCHSSHRIKLLRIRPKRYRLLKHVRRLPYDDMDKKIAECTSIDACCGPSVDL